MPTMRSPFLVLAACVMLARGGELDDYTYPVEGRILLPEQSNLVLPSTKVANHQTAPADLSHARPQPPPTLDPSTR